MKMDGIVKLTSKEIAVFHRLVLGTLIHGGCLLQTLQRYREESAI